MIWRHLYMDGLHAWSWLCSSLAWRRHTARMVIRSLWSMRYADPELRAFALADARANARAFVRGRFA